MDKHEQELLAKLAAQIASGIIARMSSGDELGESGIAEEAVKLARLILQEAAKRSSHHPHKSATDPTDEELEPIANPKPEGGGG